MNNIYKILKAFLIVLCAASCNHRPAPNQEMVKMLTDLGALFNKPGNPFSPAAVLKYSDSVINHSNSDDEKTEAMIRKGNALLQLGEEKKAIDIFQQLLGRTRGNLDMKQSILKDMAISWLRLGERLNCIRMHNAASCIFPISSKGVHQNKQPSEMAIDIYKQLLFDNPNDLESKWLLNIAYMTTGEFPGQVPAPFLLKVKNDDSLGTVRPFTDVAGALGLNYKAQAGGAIVEDFNNDGYPDVVLSSWSLDEPMRYYRNNGDGSFSDMTDSSGLAQLTGGLCMLQTDYNNDGFKDIFVLRGGWKGQYGKTPNSLLRNNGDGTFTDVTRQSGLLSFHPTQTATWADFNNDGWLDVFIGNETEPGQEKHPCELYINNKNGTFTEIAAKAGCAVMQFVKGVTSGDYNNDGLTDIFLSTLDGNKILLKNETKNGVIHFVEVSKEAGLSVNRARTFPTWFWDYDNDGWLDILVCGYEFTGSLAYYAAAEASNTPLNSAGKVFLFRNNHDGTFEDVSAKAGLDKIAFAMGSNFGDIDNDGYLDFYLGTGNPSFKSAVPNKLFKNIGGDHFLDITTSARVGNLQKGHEVCFADMNNDGNEDIYIKMGGAYPGDSYENSLYLNPGENNNNHWINLTLEGVHSNKAAIGARIKVTFDENNKLRAVYRDVNSGGSFGANPLRQHIGIGAATSIEKIEIFWPVTGKTQLITNPPINANLKIIEGESGYHVFKLKRFNFKNGAMHKM